MVERLKKYMEYRKLLPSQFADMAGLPRSSFSQMLGGHLKKINSGQLKKIHSAFPDLSISWLMFGEGEMIVPSDDSNSTTMPSTERQSEINFADESDVFQTELRESSEECEDFEETEEKNTDSNAKKMLSEMLQGGIYSEKRSEKRIVKIMVFYDDNTFESFIPE